MATKDLNNSVHVIQGIYPQVLAAAKTADNAADLSIGDVAGATPGATSAGACESAEVIFTYGAVTGSATALIEESDDNSTYTTVAAADLLGGALAAVDTTYQNKVVKRGYRGTKRYIRARFSAGAASFAVGVAIVLSHPRHLPTPVTA